MSWKSIDIQCQNPDCKHTVYGEVVRKEEVDDRWECPACGGEMKHQPFLTAPLPLRASYADGQRRKGFRELAEASRIEADSYNLPPEKRGHHNDEIRKLKKVD